MYVYNSVIVYIGYRDVERGTIAQRNERVINPFLEQYMIIKAYTGSIAYYSPNSIVHLLHAY